MIKRLITQFAKWLLRVNGDFIVVLPARYFALTKEIAVLCRFEEQLLRTDLLQGTKPQPGWVRRRRVQEIMGKRYPELDQRLLSLAIECTLLLHEI